MRREIPNPAPGVRHSKALVVRGGVTRTFGGLASFLAVTFFCSGMYILEDAFANPLSAQAAALIFGAFITALATVLFYFLLRPGKRTGLARRRHVNDAAPAASRPSFTAAPAAIAQTAAREDLPYQRVYVDHSRIRS